jgi:predicted ArsR family transcriptional regulator
MHEKRDMQTKSPLTSRADDHATEDARWTFLTNHAHVLRVLAADADVRVRDLAARVGITERAALRILHDLEASEYVERERVGRRTHYRLRLDQAMRHPMERGLPVGALLHALESEADLPEPAAG